jgi:hypothetical protein
MLKQWTRKSPSGRSVVYSYVETEFEISATALIKRTRQVYSRVLSSSMTREEVEREFQRDIRPETRPSQSSQSKTTVEPNLQAHPRL